MYIISMFHTQIQIAIILLLYNVWGNVSEMLVLSSFYYCACEAMSHHYNNVTMSHHYPNVTIMSTLFFSPGDQDLGSLAHCLGISYFQSKTINCIKAFPALIQGLLCHRVAV